MKYKVKTKIGIEQEYYLQKIALEGAAIKNKAWFDCKKYLRNPLQILKPFNDFAVRITAFKFSRLHRMPTIGHAPSVKKTPPLRVFFTCKQMGEEAVGEKRHQ